MRISLLEKREDFYDILERTLNDSFLNKEVTNEKSKFIVNRYLNFIASPMLPKITFKILINEYSSSLIWWKKALQYYYVKLATSLNTRVIFSHNHIKLPSTFDNYLILGGNHRIRLFNSKLESSIVILKNKESNDFITNDIFIRTKNNLSYAPKILTFGQNWLKEEYIEGTPINRLKNEFNVDHYINSLVENHFNSLINKTTKIVSIDTFQGLVLNEIKTNLNRTNFKNKLFEEKLFQLLEKLFSMLKIDSLKLSWSHGDFQQANILLINNTIKVIDWESANKRFYLYDFFVLYSSIRTGVSLNEAIENFKLKVNEVETLNSIGNNDILLLLIEEIRFSVKENFSLNFYEPGDKTNLLIDAIKNYLND